MVVVLPTRDAVKTEQSRHLRRLETGGMERLRCSRRRFLRAWTPRMSKMSTPYRLLCGADVVSVGASSRPLRWISNELNSHRLSDPFGIGRACDMRCRAQDA